MTKIILGRKGSKLVIIVIWQRDASTIVTYKLIVEIVNNKEESTSSIREEDSL